MNLSCNVRIFFFSLLFSSDELFDYSALLNNTAEVNLAHAFKIAAEQLDVPRLLEPEGTFQKRMQFNSSMYTSFFLNQVELSPFVTKYL